VLMPTELLVTWRVSRSGDCCCCSCCSCSGGGVGGGGGGSKRESNELLLGDGRGYRDCSLPNHCWAIRMAAS